MIILNGRQFAESDDEFVSTLFDKTRTETAYGYAKRLKRQVKLFDHQKNLIGMINKYGCLCKATPQGGKYWYSYGDIDLIKGDEYPYSVQQNDIDKLIVSREWINGDSVAAFK